MSPHVRFGSREYFKRLDDQVVAQLAPQLSAGIMKIEQANEIRATAQRRAQKKFDRFYGLNNKYDGKGRLRAA